MIGSTWSFGCGKRFAGLPGESRVIRGDFAMFKQYGNRTGPQIPIEQWKRCVFADDRVVMSMLVRSGSTKGNCRKCGTTSHRGVDENVWRE